MAAESAVVLDKSLVECDMLDVGLLTELDVLDRFIVVFSSELEASELLLLRLNKTAVLRLTPVEDFVGLVVDLGAASSSGLLMS